MEKKVKFSDKSTVSKLVYSVVIAILCISAIVIGIVAANSRKPSEEPTPPADEGQTPGEDSGNANKPGTDNGGTDNKEEAPKELAFISPAVGTVIKSHSSTVPVFSNTLDEWRIHTGIDVSTEEGAEVYAAEAGVVSRVYFHPMLGKTIEITHNANHKSIYSNLDSGSVKLVAGDEVEAGAVIGKVGDTSVSEMADEPHLHFELMVDGKSVNPLDYITDESKTASLGIVTGAEEV